ncbi:MAG: hypothetical protein AAGA99_11650 [Actinomycetota bacterium]
MNASDSLGVRLLRWLHEQDPAAFPAPEYHGREVTVTVDGAGHVTVATKLRQRARDSIAERQRAIDRGRRWGMFEGAESRGPLDPDEVDEPRHAVKAYGKSALFVQVFDDDSCQVLVDSTDGSVTIGQFLKPEDTAELARVLGAPPDPAGVPS